MDCLFINFQAGTNKMGILYAKGINMQNLSLIHECVAWFVFFYLPNARICYKLNLEIYKTLITNVFSSKI